MVKSTQIARIDGIWPTCCGLRLLTAALGLMLAASVDEEQVNPIFR